KSNNDETEKYIGFVRCHGRISRLEVNALYRRSHFSVLFREKERYALAGFPTKAVESWSAGCPIIGNAVGDFGAIASHMKDSILVDEANIAAELGEALSVVLSGDTYKFMSYASQTKARRSFSGVEYRDRLEAFMMNVR